MCGEGESNPHVQRTPGLESGAATSYAIPARTTSVSNTLRCAYRPMPGASGTLTTVFYGVGLLPPPLRPLDIEERDVVHTVIAAQTPHKKIHMGVRFKLRHKSLRTSLSRQSAIGRRTPTLDDVRVSCCSRPQNDRRGDNPIAILRHVTNNPTDSRNLFAHTNSVSCAGQDSNLRPKALETPALPLSYRRLVGSQGIEPQKRPGRRISRSPAPNFTPLPTPSQEAEDPRTASNTPKERPQAT